ncbi:MAG: sigma-54-dependent Fis family transcriptional regulator [Sandaracinaceae bacterium]|nr:sigma-54-dependent Fis family transcriptional regulator [Sandaracinaceae bacterium]
MNESVLLIDDEKSFRVIVEAALREEGYDVRTAPNAALGIELWRKAPTDLVILDRNLPDADGVDVLAQLVHDARERSTDTVVLMVTAYAEVDNAVDALRRGADDYITKPVQLPDLVIKLQKALERRRLERRVRALKSREGDVSSQLEKSKSPAMLKVLDMARRVAASPDTAVLLQGETGSGKDMLARYIHAHTAGRSEAALIELNCAAIADSLAETELFGHERGAFTDAKASKPGLLELATEGTLFLDEIGDLGLGIQAKLLRVLETMRFRRVGGTRDLSVDIRFISATNRDLAHDVEEGRFRLDLFHRIDVFHLVVPPLRERPEDILPLAETFMRTTALRLGRKLDGIDDAAVDALSKYPYPGNVRELRNVIERAMILETGTKLTANSLVLGTARTAPSTSENFFSVRLPPGAPPPTLRQLEALYLEHILAQTDGNKTQAARILDVSFPTIAKKVAEGGIKSSS